MLSLLFWNVNRRDLRARIARLASSTGADVLALAECRVPPEELVAALNSGLPAETPKWHYPEAFDHRLLVFSRLPVGAFVNEYDSALGDVTIRRIRKAPGTDVLLMVVHLPSKLEKNREEQLSYAQRQVRRLREVETKVGHARTVVIGDLNMNPFEPGMVMADAFHAVMTRRIARDRDGVRVVDGEPRMFFFNPMWRFLGERSDPAGGEPRPSGTYYLAGGRAESLFWNTYDQVLLRPPLMDALRELRILESDGVESLLTPSGRPSRARGSDHLPIFARLDV